MTLVMTGGKPKQITYECSSHMVLSEIVHEHMKTVEAFSIQLEKVLSRVGETAGQNKNK